MAVVVIMRGKVGVEEWSSYRGDNLNLQLLALVDGSEMHEG